MDIRVHNKLQQIVPHSGPEPGPKTEMHGPESPITARARQVLYVVRNDSCLRASSLGSPSLSTPVFGFPVTSQCLSTSRLGRPVLRTAVLGCSKIFQSSWRFLCACGAENYVMIVRQQPLQATTPYVSWVEATLARHIGKCTFLQLRHTIMLQH